MHGWYPSSWGNSVVRYIQSESSASRRMCLQPSTLVQNEKLETDMKIAPAPSSITVCIRLVLSAFLHCHYLTVLELSVFISLLHYITLC